MTDDERGLLNAIIESPDCDTVRLVYADWLEEQGQAERAEFIRLSIAHDGVPKTRTPDMPYLEWRQIRDRAESLFELHWRDWFPSHATAPRTLIYLIAKKASINGGTECEHLIVDRGFVAEICCTLAQFMGGECENCGGTGRVDGDRYEQSEPCPTCGGEYGPSDEDNPSGVVPGTGTTPGLARTLFGHHPITRVVLTGCEPNDYGPPEDQLRFGWLSEHEPSHSGASRLPRQLLVLMKKMRFPTREAAIAAKSAAAVDYGRGLCGRKPLSPEARHAAR
jgi:uncharacterized protein (TIGR02996 family)